MDNCQFSIPLGGDDLARRFEFAAEHGLGVEVVAFASGPCLYEETTRFNMRRELDAALAGFPHALSYHGAFIDLSVHSSDPAVAAVAHDRIQRDLEMASGLGCTTAVFHTGFNPLVPIQRYQEEFVERHAAFWPDTADAWPEITICLENLWEPSPHLLDRVLGAIGHPRVTLCLDVAHAHVYGEFGVGRWMDCLRERIAHMHWNDNEGDADAHLAIGQGNVPWKEILSNMRTLPTPATVVLEMKSLEAISESIRFLKRLDSMVLASGVRAPAMA